MYLNKIDAIVKNAFKNTPHIFYSTIGHHYTHQRISVMKHLANRGSRTKNSLLTYDLRVYQGHMIRAI
jgi:hypothetical protein